MRFEDQGAETAAFAHDLTALMPQVRAFAISIGGREGADDLAQDAILRAWGARRSYEPGTNMRAWVFQIVRNLFLSGKRRDWRWVSLNPDAAETLLAADDSAASLDVDEVRRALALLPHDQREALVLVGASGASYKEAAGISGCAIGTVKSRVSRARVNLQKLLEEGA